MTEGSEITNRDKTRLLVIQGATASGKTDLAIDLAKLINGEIINADSMQVYLGMDIGTAKPSPEQLAAVPHHLLNMVSPDMNFSAGDFRREAVKTIAEITSRRHTPVVAGGTGLYIRGLLHGLADTPPADAVYREELQGVIENESGAALLAKLALVDPETAALLHPNDHVRIIRALEVFRQTGIPVASFRNNHRFLMEEYSYLKIGIRVERKLLYERIDSRVDRMVANGFVDEVSRLLEAGYGRDLKSMKSIGYREIAAYLAGEISLDEAVYLVKRNTRHYAKRQETWLRADKEISWVEYPGSFDSIKNHVIAFFA